MMNMKKGESKFNDQRKRYVVVMLREWEPAWRKSVKRVVGIYTWDQSPQI